MEIRIKTPTRSFIVPEGRPVIIQWKAKNKSRAGLGMAMGWIKRGDDPHTVKIIHSTFQTWDKLESEYPASWTIWKSQILDIRIMKREALNA